MSTDRNSAPMILQIHGLTSVKHDPDELPVRIKHKQIQELIKFKHNSPRPNSDIRALFVTQNKTFKDHNKHSMFL